MKKSCFVLLFVAMFALVACNTPNTTGNNGDDNNPPTSEEVTFVNNLMAQYGEFDAETLIQGLPGVWVLDAEYMYEEGWQNIKSVNRYKGDSYLEGDYISKIFTFTADGNCEYSVSYDENGAIIDNKSVFEWNYESESKKLVLSKESYSAQYTVSGFSGEYIILDHIREVYDAHADYRIYYYTREIYKRQAE